MITFLLGVSLTLNLGLAMWLKAQGDKLDQLEAGVLQMIMETSDEDHDAPTLH